MRWGASQDPFGFFVFMDESFQLAYSKKQKNKKKTLKARHNISFYV
jgi:predicted branched-subunit amino acid permease